MYTNSLTQIMISEDKKQNYDAADLKDVTKANPPFLYVTDKGNPLRNWFPHLKIN